MGIRGSVDREGGEGKDDNQREKLRREFATLANGDADSTAAGGTETGEIGAGSASSGVALSPCIGERCGVRDADDSLTARGMAVSETALPRSDRMSISREYPPNGNVWSTRSPGPGAGRSGCPLTLSAARSSGGLPYGSADARSWLRDMLNAFSRGMNDGWSMTCASCGHSEGEGGILSRRGAFGRWITSRLAAATSCCIVRYSGRCGAKDAPRAACTHCTKTSSPTVTVSLQT